MAEEKASEILSSLKELSIYRCFSQDASKRFPVENPATGETITIVQAGDAKTAAKSIEASVAAFNSWRRKTTQERSTYLLRAAEEIQAHAEDLAILLCLENEKPWKDAMFDVGFAVQAFRYFGSVAGIMPSELFDQGNIDSAVVYEPHGICAGILPFNWPSVRVDVSAFNALACAGCCGYSDRNGYLGDLDAGSELSG